MVKVFNVFKLKAMFTPLYKNNTYSIGICNRVLFLSVNNRETLTTHYPPIDPMQSNREGQSVARFVPQSLPTYSYAYIHLTKLKATRGTRIYFCSKKIQTPNMLACHLFEPSSFGFS